MSWTSNKNIGVRTTVKMIVAFSTIYCVSTTAEYKVRTRIPKEKIISIKLKKGQAAFRLVSEEAHRVATVQVFNGDGALQDRYIRIEFI